MTPCGGDTISFAEIGSIDDSDNILNLLRKNDISRWEVGDVEKLFLEEYSNFINLN